MFSINLSKKVTHPDFLVKLFVKRFHRLPITLCYDYMFTGKATYEVYRTNVLQAAQRH